MFIGPGKGAKRLCRITPSGTHISAVFSTHPPIQAAIARLASVISDKRGLRCEGQSRSKCESKMSQTKVFHYPTTSTCQKQMRCDQAGLVFPCPNVNPPSQSQFSRASHPSHFRASNSKSAKSKPIFAATLTRRPETGSRRGTYHWL